MRTSQIDGRSDEAGSPRLLQFSARSWGKDLQSTPFKFAPAENTRFFERFGWKENAYRGMMDEARRLGRAPMSMNFWRLVMWLYPRRIREEFKRFSGCVLLERA